MIDSINRRIAESEQIQEKLIIEVERTLLEHGATDRSILGNRDSLITLTETAKESILNSGSEQSIIQAIATWNEYLPTIFETEKSAEINTNLPSELLGTFALLELNERTNRVLEEMVKAAVPKQDSYDFLRLFFEPNSTDLRYGESYEGKVYFGATSEHTPNIINITVNGSKVEFTEGGVGTFTVTPTKRGIFEVKAVAEGKTGTMSENIHVEKSFNLNVK